MNPLWLSGGASVFNALTGFAGGLLNQGLSERDSMEAQGEIGHRYWKKQLREGPYQQRVGLEQAGINPMLPYSNGGAGPSASFSMPSAKTPPQPKQEAMRGLQAGVATALEIYRAMKEIDKIEAETETEDTLRDPRLHVALADAGSKYSQGELNAAKTATEGVLQGRLEADRVLSTARAQHTDQLFKIALVDEMISKQNFSIRAREALEAAYGIEVLNTSVGEMASKLKQLGITPDMALDVANLLLRGFRKSAPQRKGRVSETHSDSPKGRSYSRTESYDLY